MRLVCPCCGALASADAWEGDAMMRRAMVIACGLPQPISKWALGYLALFRPVRAGGRAGPPPRGLTWKKAARLLEELKALVDAEEIVWGQGTPLPNRVEAWSWALQRVCDQPPRELPLRNHNYLRTIAYRIASQMEGEAERAREEGRRDPYRREADRPQGVGSRHEERQEQALTADEIERNRARAREMVEKIAGKRGGGDG